MKKVIVPIALILSACASPPEKIATAYVSTYQYERYDCDQLSAEADHVARRIYELHANLKTTADNDAAQMGVGLILFWPTLFFLEGGDGAEAAEYARLKGEREAIEKVSIAKKCGIRFEPLVPAQKTAGEGGKEGG